MLTVLVALLAGTLTVAAPCTLPVLPILLGASVAPSSNARPVFIALGFVMSFSGVAITFSVITQIFGIDQKIRSARLQFLFSLASGCSMLWPRPFEWLAAYTRGLFGRNDQKAGRAYGGNFGGFFLGTTLGLVWTPCAGPALGSILTVIATSPSVFGGKRYC